MSKYYNIVVLYKSIFSKHRITLSKYAECILYTGQALECDKLIWNSSWGEYPRTIKHKGKPIQVLHANYREVFKLNGFKYPTPKEETEHIAVSKHVSEVFEDMYKIPSKVINNMLNPEIKVEKVLRLITCSRLTKEKGIENILKFARELKKRNKKFIWLIYGNGNTNIKEFPEIIIMGVSYDLTSYLADADYMAHFSLSEGDPYCTKEALQVNTPCITTSYPATYEQIEDGKNGYILDFDLFTKGTEEEWDKIIEKIYKKIPKFKYENKDEELEKQWLEILGKPKGIKREIKEQEKNFKVKSLLKINYMEEKIKAEIGTEFIVEDKERLEYLLGNNPSNKVYVKLL